MAKGKVVSILNMKGGVGKTTISAHLMRVLYHECDKRVLLVDLDPQFNLSQTVLTEKKYNKIVKDKKTVLSAFEPQPSNNFFDIIVTDSPPPPASAICTRLKQVQASAACLDMIVGDFDLVKYSLIDDNKKLGLAIKYFKRFISQARDEYDLVVIDCNPSSSFITQCALTTSTHILSPVRPDKYSVIGVRLVSDLLDRIAPDPRPEQLIVMNAVPRGSSPETVETELRSSKFAASVLANRLHKSSLLAAQPSYTGFATDKRVAYKEQLKSDMKKLAIELASRLGV
jgi:chromosome partitioning protein